MGDSGRGVGILMQWIEPPDVEPVCPKHGCALYPARTIPCPICGEESDEWEADQDDGR